MNFVLRVPALGLLVATFLIAGCGGGSASTPIAAPPAPAPTPISIAISPTSATVQTGQSATFTATVTNDSAAKGVSWMLAGSGCSSAMCGTISTNSGGSGSMVTYTAPASVPSAGNVTLSATSVSDGTKSATVTITIIAAPAATIAVTLSQTTATVPVSGTTTFTATVTNDSANKGLTWVLSGAGCSGLTCGSVSSSSSASGAPITYTAPASVPSGTVALTATSIADGTKSAGATIIITAAPAIVVVVSPMTASVATGGAIQSFTATLQNDSQDKGVTWTVSGTACTGAACRTVMPTSSASDGGSHGGERGV